MTGLVLDALDDREWKPGWRAVAYVDDGMEVWIAWPPHTGTQALKCRVACAAGDRARIVNEPRGIDTWAHISELRLTPLEPPQQR